MGLEGVFKVVNMLDDFCLSKLKVERKINILKTF